MSAAAWRVVCRRVPVLRAGARPRRPFAPPSAAAAVSSPAAAAAGAPPRRDAAARTCCRSCGATKGDNAAAVGCGGCWQQPWTAHAVCAGRGPLQFACKSTAAAAAPGDPTRLISACKLYAQGTSSRCCSPDELRSQNAKHDPQAACHNTAHLLPSLQRRLCGLQLLPPLCQVGRLLLHLLLLHRKLGGLHGRQAWQVTSCHCCALCNVVRPAAPQAWRPAMGDRWCRWQIERPSGRIHYEAAYYALQHTPGLPAQPATCRCSGKQKSVACCPMRPHPNNALLLQVQAGAAAHLLVQRGAAALELLLPLPQLPLPLCSKVASKCRVCFDCACGSTAAVAARPLHVACSRTVPALHTAATTERPPTAHQAGAPVTEASRTPAAASRSSSSAARSLAAASACSAAASRSPSAVSRFSSSANLRLAASILLRGGSGRAGGQVVSGRAHAPLAVGRRRTQHSTWQQHQQTHRSAIAMHALLPRHHCRQPRLHSAVKPTISI